MVKDIEKCDTCKYKMSDSNAMPCIRCIHQSLDRYETETNGDKIRRMTDEELAMCMMCPNDCGLAEIECGKSDQCDCYQCILKWLKEEVGDTDVS